MDYLSGLITIHDDVDITELTPHQCTTVQELIEPCNNYTIDPPKSIGSVHSNDATGSPTTTVSDSPFGADHETDPFGPNIANTQPLRPPNYAPFDADGSHHSGIPYFIPQNQNIFDLGVKIRQSMTTPSPLPGNMNYNTIGVEQDGNASGVQVQSQPNVLRRSDYQLPTPQVSGHLRNPYASCVQPGSMDQAIILQPNSNQVRNYLLQPPKLQSQDANKWLNRAKYNGFPWGLPIVPNAQFGYQAYPPYLPFSTAGRDHYSLPREITASMNAQLPTPPAAPFEEFDGWDLNPADPMPQATFYNPKNQFIERENLVDYRGTILTRRESCLIVAMDRYLHKDINTIAEVLRFHRHDYQTPINLTGFIDWALAHPDKGHMPTSKTESDYQAARKKEATKPITVMIVKCLNTSASFWARQASRAHNMWRIGMTEMIQRLRAEGDLDKYGNIVEGQQPNDLIHQQQPNAIFQQQQQQDLPSQDRGRTMLQTPNETRHPSVQQASTPKQRTQVRESPTAAKKTRCGAVQKRQKSQTPSSARRSTITTITKERKKTGTRAAKKDHSRTGSKETLGHSRTASKETLGQHSRTASKDDSRAISGTHSRTLSNNNHHQQEGSIDPALLGHMLESVIQEEEGEDGEGGEEVVEVMARETMMGTPVLATDIFQSEQHQQQQQHMGGAEAGDAINFDEWMEQEPEAEGSDGKEGGSDSEYVP